MGNMCSAENDTGAPKGKASAGAQPSVRPSAAQAAPAPVTGKGNKAINNMLEGHLAKKAAAGPKPAKYADRESAAMAEPGKLKVDQNKGLGGMLNKHLDQHVKAGPQGAPKAAAPKKK